MNFKATFFAALAGSTLCAAAASATPLDNTVFTFGYDNYQGEDATGGEIERQGKWVRADTTFGLFGFDVDLGASHGDLMKDGAQTTFSIAPKADFGGGMKFGGYVDYTMLEDQDVQHYGAVADYQMGDLALSGYLGYGVYEDENSNVYGVSATYDLAGSFEAGAFYNAENFDSREVSEMGASIGYNMTAFSIPGKLTGTYSVQNFDEGETKADKVTVTYSIPLGQSGSVRPGTPSAHQRSVALARGFSTPK
jgi:hypothetical protein